jgi:hypothetical protein
MAGIVYNGPNSYGSSITYQQAAAAAVPAGTVPANAAAPAGLVLDDKVPVQDARADRAALARLGIPEPPGMDLANSFLNPLGPAPARALLLLLRRDLDALDREKAHKVRFDDGLGGRAQAGNLYFVGADPVTPGAPGDPAATYLCEFADARRQVCNDAFHHGLTNAQYNVPAPDSGLATYVHGRQSATDDWGWASLCEDLWLRIGAAYLGDWPGMAFAPDGKPNGFTFQGMSVWRALSLVLGRLGAAVAFDHSKDVGPAATGYATVVRVGAADAAPETLHKALVKAGRLLYPGDRVEGKRGKFPRKVRVLFNRFCEHFGSEDTLSFDGNFLANGPYAVDVQLKDLSLGIKTGEGEDVTTCLWDDLPAYCGLGGGSVLAASVTACAARATERAKDYVRTLLFRDNANPPAGDDGGPRQRIYTGIQPFKPGPQVSGVAWRQAPDGNFITEVIRRPGRFLRPGAKGFEEVGPDGVSLTMLPPDYNVTFPLYPRLEQVVRVVAGPSGGLYDAYFERTDPSSLTTADLHPCWLLDVSP